MSWRVDVEQRSALGVEREPRRLVDDRQSERVEEVVQRSSILVEQRVGDIDRSSHVNDARQRPVSIPILERDRFHRSAVRDVQQLEQHSGLQLGHVPGRDERTIGPGDRQPGVQAGERPLALVRVPREDDRHAGWHRWFVGVGREHDDHLGADFTQPQHRMVEQRHPAVGLGELVATEPRRAPTRQDDARDLRQAYLPAVARVPGSARTGTRTAP